MKFFTALLSALALATSTTIAAHISERDDGFLFLTPFQITSPLKGDVWPVANQQNVTWITVGGYQSQDTGEICLAYRDEHQQGELLPPFTTLSP